MGGGFVVVLFFGEAKDFPDHSPILYIKETGEAMYGDVSSTIVVALKDKEATHWITKNGHIIPFSVQNLQILLLNLCIGWCMNLRHFPSPRNLWWSWSKMAHQTGILNCMVRVAPMASKGEWPKWLFWSNHDPENVACTRWDPKLVMYGIIGSLQVALYNLIHG